MAFTAVGFDPAHFWNLTPREWSLWMDGAAGRLDADRTLLTVSAWVGAHADQRGLESYLASGGRKVLHPPEALERMLATATVGLPELSMEDFLNRKRALN